MKRIGNFESLKVAGLAITGAGAGGGPKHVGHAYRTADRVLPTLEQNLSYTNKFDPDSILDISGDALKFTIPALTQGIVRIKTKMSASSDLGNPSPSVVFFALPIVRRVSDNLYMGGGDRIHGTWTNGENLSGLHFPTGDCVLQLVPGVQYSVRFYTSVGFTCTGGTNGSGDVNFSTVEIW